MLTNLRRGMIFTLLSGLLYGSMGYFGVQLLEEGFSIVNMLLWRFIISSVIIFLYLAAKRDKVLLEPFSPTNYKRSIIVLLLGALFYAPSSMFYFLSTEWIGTGLAMVLFFTYPAMTVLLMLLVDKEKVSKETCFALAAILCGCVFIASREGFHFDIYGTALVLISALAYAAYVFSSQKTIKIFDAKLAGLLVCFGNLVFFFIATLLTHSLQMPTSGMMWFNILGLALLATVLPLLFLLEGLKFISASKAAILSVLEPITTLVLGVILLAEPISWVQLMGAVLVLSGAAIIQFSR